MGAPGSVQTPSEVVWPWREAGRKPAKEDAASRRKRSALEAGVGWTVGLVVFFVWPDHRLVSYIAWSIATIVFVGGQVVPPLYYGIQKLFQLLAKAVGIALSWVLLVPFFYLCFPIGHLFCVLSGKDPMERKCPTDMKTYWVKREPIKNMGQYEKQY